MEKETNALEEAQRSLLDTQDCLDKQKDDMQLDKIKAEVSRNQRTIQVFPKNLILFFFCCLQNVKLRLQHAYERVERARQTIEDKRASSLKAIQQLEKDYIVMGKERSEADKRNAERRAQAEEMQRKVSPSCFVPFRRGSSSRCERVPYVTITEHPLITIFFADGRSPEGQQSIASTATRRILGTSKKDKWVPFSPKGEERTEALCVTDSYMENIAKRLGIDPASFLEKT